MLTTAQPRNAARWRRVVLEALPPGAVLVTSAGHRRHQLAQPERQPAGLSGTDFTVIASSADRGHPDPIRPPHGPPGRPQGHVLLRRPCRQWRLLRDDGVIARSAQALLKGSSASGR